MHTYRRLLEFASPLASFSIIYFIVAILAQLFGMANLLAIIPLLEILFGTSQIPQLPTDPGFMDILKVDLMTGFFNLTNEVGKTKVLYYICAGAITTTILANTFRYLSLRLQERMKAKVIRNLRTSLFNKITNLDLRYFTDQRKGEIISKATNDIYEVEMSVTNSLSSFLKDPLTIIIYFTVLFTISAKMTLFTLVIIPIMGFGINFLVKRLKKASNIAQQSIAELTSTIDETISGMRIIKAFRAVDYVNSKFEDQARRYERRYKNFAYRRELASPFSEIMGVMMVTVILIYGGGLVLSGEQGFTASFFITYLVMFTQVLNPGKTLASAISNLQRGLTSGERILEVIDTQVDIIEHPNAQVLEQFENSIEYNNVNFKYENDYVLKDINLTIPKGSTVALVGPSGGGKSTIADLLPRFYDATEGTISMDGINIKDLKIDSLRKHIGIVSQESILFNDTVFNNIAFGVQSALEDAVIQAAKIANAHDFIMNLSEGYQTVIGERGLKLSGGQRQRVSIARSIFKNPPILIMDEATSALDTESEKLVQEALDNLMKNRTSIVIAHRLSTIQNADQIVVIDKGQIVEQGTHNELINLNGIYTKLSSMQEV